MYKMFFKPEIPIVIVSDIHIGSGVSNLHTVKKLMESEAFIIFAGDILDLYLHTYEDLAKGEGKWLIDWFKANPKKFVYVVGNHDRLLWKEKKLPFHIYDSVMLEQNGQTFFICHGHEYDKLNRSPKWYQWPAIWFEYAYNRLFHTNLQQDVLEKHNTFSALAKDIQKDLIPSIRAAAQADCERRNVDCLIHGHTHYPGEFPFGTDFVRTVIDSGSFVVGESYVTITNGSAHLIKVIFW